MAPHDHRDLRGLPPRRWARPAPHPAVGDGQAAMAVAAAAAQGPFTPVQDTALRLAYLGGHTLPAELVAIAAAVSVDEARDAAERLVELRLLRRDARGFYALPACWSWYRTPTGAQDAQHAQWELSTYRRMFRALGALAEHADRSLGRPVPSPTTSAPTAAAVAGLPTGQEALALARRVREVVPGLVDQATALGLYDDGVELATRWWAIGDALLEDPADRCLDQLAAAAETAALATQMRHVLAGVLDAAARCALRQHVLEPVQRFLLAEGRWVHALAVWRHADHAAPQVPLIEDLLQLYLRWPRPSKALDALFDLRRLHERLNTPDEVCWALVREAVLLLRIARPDTAQQRAARAARMLTDAAAAHVGTERRATRADVDILLGHTHWHAGSPAQARTAWHAALARLVEVDEPRAEDVRVLLGLRKEDPLPPDPVLTALLDPPPTAPTPRARSNDGDVAAEQ